MTDTRRTFSKTSVTGIGVRKQETVAEDVKVPPSSASSATVAPQLDPKFSKENLPEEIGGYEGPEPTRFGDWSHDGRCTDF